MDTINKYTTTASKALFGDNYTVTDSSNATAPRTTETGTLGSDVGHNTTTEHNTTDPSYTHTSAGATGGPAYGTSDNVTSTSTNAGPHNSNLVNKADPRVDSDRDGSRIAGNTAGTNNYGAGNTSSSTTAGPHSSNLANKVDPRVDSGLDGSRMATGTTHGAGGAAVGGHGLNTSTNEMRQPMDSNATSIHGQQGASGGAVGGPGYNTSTNEMRQPMDSNVASIPGQQGTGFASSTTAGPHDSNLANRADPRVDSDLSRTTGNTSSTNPALTGAAGTEYTRNQPSNDANTGIKFAESVNNPPSNTGEINEPQGSRVPGETPARGLHPVAPTHGPMTGSHSHRGSGQLRNTQDTYDTIHRRDHADGADHTRTGTEEEKRRSLSRERNISQDPSKAGKGTPGGMPEMIRKGLEELHSKR